MSGEAYLEFLAVVVLVLSVSGLTVGILWSIPDALGAYRYWKREEDEPRAVYSFWRFLRTIIALTSLAAFLAIAAAILAIPDPDSYLRQFLARHLLLLVVAGLAALVISEPVAERRLDGAITDSETKRDAERDSERDAGRDHARDAGRDEGRDGPRDAARDKAHDEWERDAD